MIKGLIFDMDGTILDSMTMWDNFDREFLLKYGVIAPDDLKHKLAALGVKESSSYMADNFPIGLTAEEISSKIYAVAEEQYLHFLELKDGVMEFLQAAKVAKMPMCLATATEKMYAMHAVQRLGLGEYFDFVMSCDEVGESKQSPKIYLEAAKKLGNLDPQEVVVFEDSCHSVKTAKDAGFVVIAVQDDIVDGLELEEIKSIADGYILSFRELM